jgi:hypothetical protein
MRALPILPNAKSQNGSIEARSAFILKDDSAILEPRASTPAHGPPRPRHNAAKHRIRVPIAETDASSLGIGASGLETGGRFREDACTNA